MIAADQGAAIVFATHQLALVAEYGFDILEADAVRAGDNWRSTFRPA